MMMPSVFGRDIFDDFMDGFAFPDVIEYIMKKTHNKGEIL